MMGKTA
jgi:superfamily II DNA helicase RecQ